MTTFAERMTTGYPEPAFVRPAMKADAVRLLDNLRSEILGLEEFSTFPEGADGVVIYALLKRASRACPDLGDFNYIHQGLKLVLDASHQEIATNTDGFHL